MTVLILIHCKNITDKGVSYLLRLPHPKRLDVTYCPKVSSQMLWKLKRKGIEVNATGTVERMQY